MSNIDVLIVGAGPVGLTLALECQRQGVSFRIVDKNPAASDKSKALAVWSGTIECMAALGVAEDFLAQSLAVQGIIFSDTGREINRASLHEGIESVYPIPFLLPQSETEQILGKHLRAAGIEVERSVELTGLKNEEDGVEASLTHADGTVEIVKVKWIGACDGAHSFARHFLPVEFPGVTEPTAFLLVDGKVEGELPDDHLTINWGPTAVCAFFPVKKGVFRLFTQRAARPNHEPPTLEEMNEILKDNGLGRLRIYDPEWLAYFGVNERYTTRARVGRIFLLGDAAHIHSPAGGQGMNTGMQDAFNLGWKLGLLARGKGDPEALAESFHAERHPVAKALIDKTTKLLHFGMANNAFIRAAKDVAIKVLFQTRFVSAKLSGEFSELHIAYPDSPLVVAGPVWPKKEGFEAGTKPRDAEVLDAVTKAPVSLWRQYLAPKKHKLVIFSGKQPGTEIATEINGLIESVKTFGDELQVLVIWEGQEASVPGSIGATVYLDPTGKAHDRYGLEKAGWYLVRPDQYLAAREPSLDQGPLRTYLPKAVG